MLNNTNQKDQALLQLMRPLASFLDASDVTEIAINKPFEVLTKTFNGWNTHDVPELSATYLQALATSVIVYNGLQTRSKVSVIYPGGQRGEIVMPPAVIDGTIAFAIRKHAMSTLTTDQLENQGAFSDWLDVSFNKPTEDDCFNLLESNDFNRLEKFEVDLLGLKRSGKIKAFLESCIENKRNVIIAGKTGSGKTTVARSLIERVPYSERVITIEDVHELFLENHPNRIHMLYGTGAGRISADECLASCMRLSPDRIFLAELRGNEAWEYLNSLNTGHPGSITTTHANNALQTFERVATLIKKSEVGKQLDLEMIKQVLYTTIDVVLFVKERKITEVFYDPIFSKSKLI